MSKKSNIAINSNKIVTRYAVGNVETLKGINASGVVDVNNARSFKTYLGAEDYLKTLSDVPAGFGIVGTFWDVNRTAETKFETTFVKAFDVNNLEQELKAMVAK